MDSKAFQEFVLDLENHHGRKFNMESFRLLWPRIKAIPTGAITEAATLHLKTAYNSIPSPLGVIMKLEGEAKTLRLSAEDQRLADYEKEKAVEGELFKRLSDPERATFASRSFKLMLLMSSNAPRGKKLREYSEMVRDYPDSGEIVKDFTEQLADALASGEVAQCKERGEIVDFFDCRLYKEMMRRTA